MTRDQVIHILKTHRAELTQMGIIHASLFGSVARGDNNEDSDVDIVVDVDPERVDGIFAIGRITTVMQELIGASVDVARRDRLRSGIKKEIESESINAF